MSEEKLKKELETKAEAIEAAAKLNEDALASVAGGKEDDKKDSKDQELCWGTHRA